MADSVGDSVTGSVASLVGGLVAGSIGGSVTGSVLTACSRAFPAASSMPLDVQVAPEKVSTPSIPFASMILAAVPGLFPRPFIARFA